MKFQSRALSFRAASSGISSQRFWAKSLSHNPPVKVFINAHFCIKVNFVFHNSLALLSINIFAPASRAVCFVNAGDFVVYLFAMIRAKENRPAMKARTQAPEN